MPLYEYLCESCGRTIELIQSANEPPLTICDRCGGPVKRLLSAPAVQFKGSGWYVSDYGKGSSAASSAKKSEDAGGSASGSSSEKPASSSSGDSSSGEKK